MKLQFKDNGLLKLEHTYKGVDFLIVIKEEMNRYDQHNCYSFFRTPKGKYVYDWKAADEFLRDLSEAQIKEYGCEIGYAWYDRTHGWKNKG